MWQGLLALKNDTAAVQLHFVSGNNVLAHRSLPAPEGGPPLRIAQRMRLEASQLEGVARRMMVRSGQQGWGRARLPARGEKPSKTHRFSLSDSVRAALGSVIAVYFLWPCVKCRVRVGHSAFR